MKPVPVFQVVGKSCKFLFGNLGLFLRIAWPWMIAVGAMSLVTVRYPESGIVQQVGQFGTILLSAPVMVAWHRAVLFGERPVGVIATAFTVRELRYSGYMVVVAVISLIGVMLAARVIQTSVQVDATGGIVSLPGLLLALLIMLALATLSLRFHLVLPATAISDTRIGLQASWRLTRGNSLRLLAASLLLGVLVVLIFFLLSMFVMPVIVSLFRPDFGAMPTREEMTEHALWMSTFLIPLGLIVHFGFMALFAGLLSYIYMEIAPHPNDPLPSEMTR